MKMRKLLASGVAATLAVTSMATAASAAELSFNMGQTKGKISVSATGGLEFTETAAEGATLGLSSDEVYVKIETEDLFIHAEDGKGNASATPVNITGMTLSVTGIKGTKSNASKTYTYAFDGKDVNEDGVKDYFEITLYNQSGKNGKFVAGQFVEITNVSLKVEGETTTDNVDVYTWWTNKEDDSWGSFIAATKTSAAANDWSTFGMSMVEGSDNSVLGSNILKGMSNAIYEWYAFADKKTSVEYPFLAITDVVKPDENILDRQEIEVLSYANANAATNGGESGGLDGDQTYGDDGMGTNPNDFAGLASQVADFFNKQTNGTITFTFTSGAAASGTEWVTGGVPSTQVGIRNALGDATAKDFALFFNYNQTGALQAVTNIDKDSNSVSFDISNVLDDLGGQTKGVIDNIYYGMTKGITYDHGEGLFVESIVLAYDEDADVEADIEDDAEVEDDADVEIEDDADDAEEEDDADATGDVVVEDEDDDANPGTGVALAVVPAMVAAAAVVLSKKRK